MGICKCQGTVFFNNLLCACCDHPGSLYNSGGSILCTEIFSFPVSLLFSAAGRGKPAFHIAQYGSSDGRLPVMTEREFGISWSLVRGRQED